jgi:hypothetical protein
MISAKYERFQLKEFDTLFVMVGATLVKQDSFGVMICLACFNQNMWVIKS